MLALSVKLIERHIYHAGRNKTYNSETRNNTAAAMSKENAAATAPKNKASWQPDNNDAVVPKTK